MLPDHPSRRLSTRFALWLPLGAALLLSGCIALPPRATEPARPAADTAAPAACSPAAPCPVCPVCPAAEPPVPTKPPEKPLQPAAWGELPGWTEDPLAPAFDALLASCPRLTRNAAGLATWEAACREGAGLADRSPEALRRWFEAAFRPWAAVNADGTRQGLVTGYYEPLLRGSRQKSARSGVPVFGPPEDLVVVDLAELYPELKHLRLRGRLDGRRLVPYYSRAEWEAQESKRSPMLWVEDPIDFFFLQIQGSGQVLLPDGQRVRLNYADQNGHPYRSIGKWLLDQGELKPGEASMQGIKSWAKANPRRRSELLNANPSLVFFRELPVEGSGPPGALAVPLTPERSIAIDPRHIPLGAPVWLATTRPNAEEPLQRLMLAQDTGGAIRGVVRADFYWGTGDAAGNLAGKMRQPGRMWVLMPKAWAPDN